MPRRSTEESIRESIRPPLHAARSRPPTDPERSARWADEGIRRWHHDDRRERIPHLSCVEPVAKGRLTAGAVVWAHVPFRELDDDKTRPAVVHETRGRVVTVLAGSSSLTRRRYPDLYVELSDLGAAGLRRPTGIRRAVLFAVDLSDVLSITGALGPEDMESVFEPRPRATRVSPRITAPFHAPGGLG